MFAGTLGQRLVEGRARRRRLSGCSGSRPRRPRSRPSRRTGRGPAASRRSASGTVTTDPPPKRAPRRRPGSRARGSQPARFSPSATCANEKIASFEPSVGTTSESWVDVDVEPAVDPACNRLSELGQPRRPRIRRDRVDRGQKGFADERRRHLPGVADPEVDQLDSASRSLGFPVVEPRKRILRDLGEHGGELERHDQTVPARNRCSAA